MRYGWNDYRRLPSLRVVLNHNRYKSVESQHSCEQWQRHSPSVLRDEFHKIASDILVGLFDEYRLAQPPTWRWNRGKRHTDLLMTLRPCDLVWWYPPNFGSGVAGI